MANLWVTPEELEDVASSPYAYEACKTASFILWALSGRKYTGVRTITETYECPCRSLPATSRSGVLGSFQAYPYLREGEVFNSLSGTCSCSGTVGGRHTRLRLRGRPVRSVSKVVSGGVVLDSDKYQVINSSVLQAAPGGSLDVCGLEVTYTYGVDVPVSGRRAARYLASEFAKGWGGDECDLPERVKSVSRQNVDYTFMDDQAFLDDMRTGIYSVDLFLKAVNPDNARKPARVFSPDLPRTSRVTVNAPVNIGPYDLGIEPGEEFSWTIPLADVNGGILLDSDWAPQGQITSWNGALLLDVVPDRFTIASGNLTLDLTADETSRINISGNGTWDLYALNQVDGYTVVHVMTSNVYLV
jgi:hypothetical protein